MKILHVEDDASCRYLIRYLLENHGYEVVEAHSGEEGLALALQCHPDLILLDIHLPGMKGDELAGVLSKDVRTSRIPLVALTGMAMTGDRERFMKAGCQACFLKPIDVGSFVKNLETCIHSA